MTEVILEAVVVVVDLLTKPRALGWIIFFTLSIPSIVHANFSNASVITPIPLCGSGIIILLQPPIEFPQSHRLVWIFMETYYVLIIVILLKM
jgi:hypothetical protein